MWHFYLKGYKKFKTTDTSCQLSLQKSHSKSHTTAEQDLPALLITILYCQFNQWNYLILHLFDYSGWTLFSIILSVFIREGLAWLKCWAFWIFGLEGTLLLFSKLWLLLTLWLQDFLLLPTRSLFWLPQSLYCRSCQEDADSWFYVQERMISFPYTSSPQMKSVFL